MAEGIGFSIAGKLAENMVDPILKQFKYLFCHTSIIQNLSSELEDLENKRTRVQLLVGEAKRNAEHVLPDVLAWLKKVDRLKNEADDVRKITEMQCLCLKFPNLKSRYLQSRKASKTIIAVVELHKKGEFPKVGILTPSQQMPTTIQSVSECLETRISTRNEILKALMDEEINIIGICGMPGVGKTKLAKEIENEAKKLFDEVALATVSKDPDVKQIQSEIAEVLDKKIQEQANENVRARRLHERLTYDGHKKVLVILEDVWKKVDFQSIGIPSKGDRKGLKILLTSRFKGVFDKMGVDRYYEVEVLPENESLKLFKGAAGVSNDNTSELVMNLAKECGGLPLSLLIVGTALKDKKEHAWKDVLLQLRNSNVTSIEGMHDEVYKIIEFSYNYLKGEEAKSLFLLCSLFPEDHSIPIETLVRYARGLMMFKDTPLLSQTRDRVYSIVDDWKSCYMLLSGAKEYEVKLHDVVRDFCLHIASKLKQGYMVKHTGLEDEWPKPDDSSYSAISLTFNGLSELPGGLEYPNLEFLRLVNQYEAMNVPGDFFLKMNELRVVDFVRMGIRVSSLQPLKSLQTLCFDYCKFEIEISAIGGLENLETLSFYGSNYLIDHFPIEIAQLSNLKSLDLRFEEGPHPLPRGVLSRLKKLEELYLGDYFQTWCDEEGKDEEEEDQGFIITEISSLTELEKFQICTYDPEFLVQILKTLNLEKLQRFQIILSLKRSSTEDYHFEKSLHLLVPDANLLSEHVICSILQHKEIDDFILRVNDSNINVVSELDEDGFKNLKKLLLLSCNFEYLIDATGPDFAQLSGTFKNLEYLKLHGLDNLVAICKGNLPWKAFESLQVLNLKRLPIMEHLWGGVINPPSLSNLRNLKITKCGSIKSLFPESITKCLPNLQSLDVSMCPALEEIVSSDTNITHELVGFQKLKYIKLWTLTNFKSFRSESNDVSKEENPDVPKPLFNQVLLPNLEVLDAHSLDGLAKVLGDDIQLESLNKLRVVFVRSCRNLLNIAQSDAIKRLQNLESLQVEDCEKLQVLFDFEGVTESILGELRSMKLLELPKLVTITKKMTVPKGIRVFQNLKSLLLEECGSMRYLFSPSMANSLVRLETLRVMDCKSIEEIVGKEEEETSGIETDGAMANKIMFPKLSNLHLMRLESLRMLCSQNIGLNFPSLHKLVLVDCPMVKKLCEGKLSARKLKKIDVGDDGFVDISNFLVRGSQDIKV